MYYFIFSIIILSAIGALWIVNRMSERKVERSKAGGERPLKRHDSHIVVRICVSLMLLGFIAYHVIHFRSSYIGWAFPIIIFSFIWNSFLIISSLIYQPHDADENSRLRLNTSMHKVIVMPVYNEDRTTFDKALESIAGQSVLPDVLYIIEDGSKEENRVEDIVRYWQSKVRFAIKYIYIENQGKRQAQAHAFREYMNITDVFLTIDSDTILDRRAVEEACVPFLDDQVMSVAGLLLPVKKKNLLSRLVGVGFVSSFTNGRAAASAYSSVGVSCGGLAAYRSIVIQKFLPDYINQIVFKKRASFGDDRMLTHYASLLGKTVYQETAIGHTLMPARLSHLTRQRIRWWRSYWWGGMFIVRHHTPKSMIWWFISLQFICQVAYDMLFPVIMLILPIVTRTFPWHIILYSILLGYKRGFRMLGIRKSDDTRFINIFQYLICIPFSTILHIYLCTILSYVGFSTMYKVGQWGTRDNVEVGIEEQIERSEEDVA